MLRKTFLPLLVILLLVGGCRTPLTPTPTPPNPLPIPTPNPLPTELPVVQPPVIQPPIQVDPQPTTNAIPRDVFNSISEGTSIRTWTSSSLKGIKTALPLIPQPGGGYLYRYRLLDSDGQWRQRHANFIVDSSGMIVRKSIS